MRREKRRIEFVTQSCPNARTGMVAELDLVLVNEPRAQASGEAVKESINAAKLLRACGGCLGARRR